MTIRERKGLISVVNPAHPSGLEVVLLSCLARIYEWRVEKLLKDSSVPIPQLASDLGKTPPCRAAVEAGSRVGEVCVIEKTTQGLEGT